MASAEHDRLVKLGAKWFKKNGFGVVSTELTCFRSRERPDVIGFRSTCSAIIEVKVSRSDFLRDSKKPERVREAGMGLGVYRFYLSPPHVITKEDLPSGWGLIHEVSGKLVDAVRPLGNIWCEFGTDTKNGEWAAFQHQPNYEAERCALYSIARRLAA